MEQASSDKLLGWISLSLHLQLHPIPARTARTSTSVTHSGTSERRVSVPPPVPHPYSLSMSFRHSSTPNLKPWARVLCSRACATLERSNRHLPVPAAGDLHDQPLCRSGPFPQDRSNLWTRTWRAPTDARPRHAIAKSRTINFGINCDLQRHVSHISCCLRADGTGRSSEQRYCSACKLLLNAFLPSYTLPSRRAVRAFACRIVTDFHGDTSSVLDLILLQFRVAGQETR